MKKAHSYLKGSGQGNYLKKRARNNADLTYMGVAHSVADLIQRGVNPKDVDFQKIDWGVSYSNIRGQIKDLASKNSQGTKFDVEQEKEMKSGREKADAMARKARSEMIENKASFIERGNPQWSRYVDQSKQAKKEFSKPFTNEEYRKWRRNQDKYDMEGVDSKRPRDERVKVEKYPFQQSNKSRIKEMMMENALSDGLETPQNRYADKLSKKKIVSGQRNSGKTKFRNKKSKIWSGGRTKSQISSEKKVFVNDDLKISNSNYFNSKKREFY